MATAKKFGAFTGVFTPSVLTILGVIMYLRLPVIVGQGGILMAVGIIVVAHVISVTTGLSVSSIATDKRVKAGGTYYMISRSLGLPIGGTLGLALFVGLSFSVSLYVLGFSESFLAFWDIDVSKNTLRLVGTITLIVVTTVTFISTALALKTQYYILTAIVLSLVSIALGRHEFGPDTAAATTFTSTVPFIVLFGIFFPAVTGFEAGVSMSGDLRDPKKSIPIGTISAIFVGLAVYLALAIFLGKTVSAEALRTNSNVLVEIALVSPLVVAGVWGATISSAFGSILGAPRILQATAVDRITPRFLAHGHGKENEPRRAMMVTFAIAEAGILIGELDVIARVVSMFFITTYGFLNLSAASESWVSPDFRPEFRVPKVVPIIGSIACFVVMIQLDILAMIGSTLVLGTVYVYLARKHLTLESGDTWEGVWSSLVRGALRRLSESVQHRRNWRPNILQFGSREREPELLEFATTLVEHRGLLTNVEVTIANTEFPRKELRKDHDQLQQTGVFHRLVESPNEYEGIATVAGLYGFSGIDPNTVMLGWPDDAGTDEQYGSLVRRLAAMNHNLLLLRTGQRGFGERKHVDVWWSGYGRNIAFAIALVRFMTSSDDWPVTHIRFLVVNNGDQSLNETIARSVRLMLNEHRVDGAIRVITNGLERRPLHRILAAESKSVDLTIIGLPDNLTSSPQAAIRSIARLLEGTGTSLLIRASSFFPETSVIPKVQPIPIDAAATDSAPDASGPELAKPKVKELAVPIRSLDDAMRRLATETVTRFINPTLNEFRTLLQLLEGAMETTFRNLQEASEGTDQRRRGHALNRVQSAFLFRTEEMLEKFAQGELAVQHERLLELPGWYRSQWTALLTSAPPVIRIEAEQARPRTRWWRRIRRVRFRKKLAAVLGLPTEVILLDVTRSMESAAQNAVAELQSLFRRINDGIARVEAAHDHSDVSIEGLIDTEHQRAAALLVTAREHLAGAIGGVEETLLTSARNNLNRLVRHLNGDRPVRRDVLRRRRKQSYLQDVEDLCKAWVESRKVELNEAIMTVRLSAFHDRLDTIVERGTSDLMLEIANNFLDPISKISKEIREALEQSHELSGLKLVYEGKERFEGSSIVNELFGEIEQAIQELPEEMELPAGSEGGESGPLPVRDAVQFQVDMEFTAPVRDAIDRAAPHFDSAANIVFDVVQLAGFYVDKAEESDEVDPPGSNDGIVESAIERLDTARRDIEEQRDTVSAFIDERLHGVGDEMHGVSVRRAAALLGRHERGKRGRAALDRFATVFSSLAVGIRRRLVSLQYRRSEGILLARRLGLSGQKTSQGVTRLRDFIDASTPSARVIAQLPSYYRQLFLGKPAVVPAGRVNGRGSELSEAADFVRRHQEGASGAIAIVGQPGSGRSTVVRLLANRTLARQRICHVQPPAGGTSDPLVFLRQLGGSLGRTGNVDMVMRNLPKDAAIVIHNLDLWWERRDGGDAVVGQMVDLIDRYGDQHLIIVTVSDKAYGLIDQLVGFDEHVLGVIGCRAFDAEDLKDAILTRHESTGLTYALNGTAESELGEWTIASLFTDFFRYCHGNVGDAMNAWITHIDEVSSNELTMRTPEPPATDSLDLLNPPQVALMIQLVLHRQLTYERLSRVMPMNDPELRDEVTALVRVGLINQKRDVLEVNPFVEPHLIRHLSEAQHI